MMQNQLIYQTLSLMFLGISLLVWSSCSSSDNPAVAENTSTDDQITVIPADSTPAITTGRLKGQVDAIADTRTNIRVLHNGKVIAAAEADADGNYQIDDIEPGTYTVQITARDHQATDLMVQIIADQVTPLDKVVLVALPQPASHIRGLLSDKATKKAVQNARVQLIDDLGDVREALTKATGVFEFENVPPNHQFTLVIDHDGYENQEIAVAPIPTGETAKIVSELIPIQQAEEPLPGEGLTVGTKAPDFNLPDGDGKIHALADYAEKKIVLIFYRGSW